MDNSGASVPDRALVNDDPAGHHPSGFDPSRDLPQVVSQCRVVAHLATALASVYNHKADAFEQGAWPTIWRLTGEDSAALMETLGDILSYMDAVDNGEDGWTFPIFERAHELFGRDSDGSGKAGETGTGSTVGDSAGPKDIAQGGAA